VDDRASPVEIRQGVKLRPLGAGRHLTYSNHETIHTNTISE